jgi:uncharacterized protein YyaL (SSP411 family)
MSIGFMTRNKLAKEKSPYLLQHSDNPVKWYPWCDEAFEKARLEDKPIFLSIGYSTCHWCHVMAHESFEDDKVASLMNESFVSIKVDREERPDIDGIYMTVCQMMTGSGGWPLTIIMTPDKKPFFSGTYFPKTNRFGRAGLLDLIPQIRNYWQNNREELLKSAEEVLSALMNTTNGKNGEFITVEVFHKAFKDFKRMFDSENGGFGHAPKFPTPHNLLFLLRYWKRVESNEALEMVTKTLNEMRKGGIYDQLGYGFHRYSTDERWLVPHFEKMLYDQALLIQAYVEAFQITNNISYQRTSEQILEYILRDMTSSEGGFYSAEDADSEGQEGKFYLWDVDELKEILKDDAELFIKVFNCKKDGNWIDHAAGSAPGTNILHLEESLQRFSKQFEIPEKDIENKMEFARKKLFEVRDRRIHPHKDDKILTDWNGLVISALSKAARVFNKKKYSNAAEMAVKFIEGHLFTKKERLLHRYRAGESGIPAQIDDYAFLISGLLELYETVYKVEYLKLALRLQEIQLNHYWDNKNGGFFFTSDDAEKLLIRQKEIYDGAIPSGNSVSLLNLLRLGRITGNSDFEDKAEKLIKAFSVQISKSPTAFSQFLNGVDFAIGPAKEIVVVGNINITDTQKMLNLINKKFIPNKVLLLNDPDNPEITELAGFTKTQNMVKGKSTAYICENYNCKMPINDLDKLEELLK